MGAGTKVTGSRLGKLTRRIGPVALGVTLAAGVLTPVSQAATRIQVAGAAHPGAPAHPALPADPAGGPSKSQRIKVLSAALNLMHANYRKDRFSQFFPGPVDIFDYLVGDLWRQGIDGTGSTVAVIEGWDDPGISSFMTQQDKLLGLPKAQLRTIYPDGKLPAACPAGMVALGSYGSCDAWGGELALDVLSVHVLAPYAKILITVAPADSQITDDAASQVAPPEMMRAVEYVATHHLANAISISDGTAESTYSHGNEEILAQDAGELAAAAHGVPLLVSTGDCDAAQHLAVGPGLCEPGQTSTTSRATATWDDSPWVTAVGGTTPNFSPSGTRVGSDPIWNLAAQGVAIGEGAGFSAVFNRPGYQSDVAKITKSGQRSVPDLTMDASDGTSEAAPLLAGVLALATQLNHGQNVGPINNALYHVLGPAGMKDGIADVVSGNDNAVVGTTVAVKGFAAAKGFDVASGWGTIRANAFVPALVAATKAARQDRTVRTYAAAALTALEHRIKLTRATIKAGGKAILTAPGFLPGHPVVLRIDGAKITTLTASSQGKVSYVIHPGALGLRAGQHTLTLTSLLLTQKTTFHT